MGDVADILGLAKPSDKNQNNLPAYKKRNRAPPSAKKLNLKKKKRSGLSRELAALHGGVVEVPLAPENNYKEKWNIGKKAEKWGWLEFSSSARKDKGTFCHWVRLKDHVPGQDHKFAKLNKRVPILDYNDEVYNEHLVSAEWTRSETDYLLKMCYDFDCRFIVIQDRWDLPKARTVEDLKDRFYFIQRKLIEIGGSNSNDSSWKSHILITHPYNKEQEQARKMQLDCLLRRDKQQIHEEAQISPQANQILNFFQKNKRLGKNLLSYAKTLLNGAKADKKKKSGSRKGSTSVPSGITKRVTKYHTQANTLLDSLGLGKIEKNQKYSSQLTNLKNAAALIYAFEALNNELQYEVKVHKEHRNILLAGRAKKVAKSEKEIIEEMKLDDESGDLENSESSQEEEKSEPHIVIDEEDNDDDYME